MTLPPTSSIRSSYRDSTTAMLCSPGCRTRPSHQYNASSTLPWDSYGLRPRDHVSAAAIVWQAKLTFIHNCWYRQFELLISTIPIADIRNSNCRYQQLWINVNLACHTIELHWLPVEACILKVRRRCTDCMCNGWLAFALSKDCLTLSCDCTRLNQGLWIADLTHVQRTALQDTTAPEGKAGSRTRLRGPPSLCDRAASFRFLPSSMLLVLTEGLRCFSISKGDNHCLTRETSDRQELD